MSVFSSVYVLNQVNKVLLVWMIISNLHLRRLDMMVMYLISVLLKSLNNNPIDDICMLDGCLISCAIN